MNRVKFARFCMAYKVDPDELDKVCRLIKKRAKYLETVNYTVKKDDELCEHIILRLHKLGFGAEFDSIYPTVKFVDNRTDRNTPYELVELPL